MHKLQANVDVGQQELSELRLVLERHLGVLLDTTTEKLTQALSEVLRSQPIASAGLLLERLRSSGTECELLAEHLLDGETRFFRYPAALQALAAVVLPQLEGRKLEHPRSLRLLSAGCSTGEEPYSIGMSVCEVVNCNGGGWNVNIVASDIRRQALETAERGLYPQAALKDIPSLHFLHGRAGFVQRAIARHSRELNRVSVIVEVSPARGSKTGPCQKQFRLVVFERHREHHMCAFTRAHKPRRPSIRALLPGFLRFLGPSWFSVPN